MLVILVLTAVPFVQLLRLALLPLHITLALLELHIKLIELGQRETTLFEGLGIGR